MADDVTPITGGVEPNGDLIRLEDELGRLARELTAEDVRLEAPPIDLWSAIEAQAGLPTAQTADRPVSPVPQPVTSNEGPRLRTSRIGTPRGSGGGFSPSPVPSPPARLRQRTGLYGIPAVLAAAAVLALVLATGAALIVRNTNAEITVAQAAIVNDDLPVSVAGAGTAVLKERDGDRYLELELPDLGSADDSVYEVWMIDTDIDGMISLGNLTAAGGESARIALPGSIDHTAFPIIDISVEPLDGDPTHSGQSVLRGSLIDV